MVRPISFSWEKAWKIREKLSNRKYKEMKKNSAEEFNTGRKKIIYRALNNNVIYLKLRKTNDKSIRRICTQTKGKVALRLDLLWGHFFGSTHTNWPFCTHSRMCELPVLHTQLLNKMICFWWLSYLAHIKQLVCTHSFFDVKIVFFCRFVISQNFQRIG